MSQFPLLRFSDSELSKVLLNFDISDLITYSTCSKKSKENVKKLPKQKWMKIEIRTQHHLSVTFIYHENPKDFYEREFAFTFSHTSLLDDYPIEKQTLVFDDTMVPVTGRNEVSSDTYWEDPIKGVTFLTEYLEDIFNYLPIHSLIIGDEDAEDRNILFEWIRNRKLFDVKLCYICDQGTVTDDDIDYILDNVNITRSMIIEYEPSDNYRRSHLKNLDHFCCFYSHWITMDNLITSRIKVCILENTRLTNKDLSVLVKHWLIGAFTTLEYLEIRFQNLQMTDVLNGINHKWTVSTQTKVYKCNNYCQQYEKVISDGYTIVRSDNFEASIAQYNDGRGDSFQMVMWPEENILNNLFNNAHTG